MRANQGLFITAVLLFVACNKTNSEGTGEAAKAASARPGAARIVAVSAGEEGFEPSQIEAKQGEQVTLRFTRKSKDTCADKVVFPELGVTKDLPLNQPVDIEVPTAKSRTLSFQCGMGMFKSSVVIN